MIEAHNEQNGSLLGVQSAEKPTKGHANMALGRTKTRHLSSTRSNRVPIHRNSKPQSPYLQTCCIYLLILRKGKQHKKAEQSVTSIDSGNGGTTVGPKSLKEKFAMLKKKFGRMEGANDMVPHGTRAYNLAKNISTIFICCRRTR